MQGILVASDQTLEWLLPWWWEHYTKHNDSPVAFADLGLSEKMQEWCKERGTLFKLPLLNLPSFDRSSLPPERKKQWEDLFPESLWKRRPIWFQKPFVLSQSPFEKTLWIDVDCMIRGSLRPLFEIEAELAIAKEREVVQIMERERGFLLAGEICYNSGVIAYVKRARFLELWIEQIQKNHWLFITDQHALSRAIFLYDLPIFELSHLYNWSMYDGPNDQAIVHHYHGALKMEIADKLLVKNTSS